MDFLSHNAFLYGDYVRDAMKKCCAEKHESQQKEATTKKERRKEIAKGCDEGVENIRTIIRIARE